MESDTCYFIAKKSKNKWPPKTPLIDKYPFKGTFEGMKIQAF